MTNGPRNTPAAPNTAPGSPGTDGSLPAGVDSIGEGFDGSTVGRTVDDGNVSSIQPQEPLPENATETEKELVENKEELQEAKNEELKEQEYVKDRDK